MDITSPWVINNEFIPSHITCRYCGAEHPYASEDRTHAPGCPWVEAQRLLRDPPTR